MKSSSLDGRSRKKMYSINTHMPTGSVGGEARGEGKQERGRGSAMRGGARQRTNQLAAKKVNAVNLAPAPLISTHDRRHDTRRTRTNELKREHHGAVLSVGGLVVLGDLRPDVDGEDRGLEPLQRGVVEPVVPRAPLRAREVRQRRRGARSGARAHDDEGARLGGRGASSRLGLDGARARERGYLGGSITFGLGWR